MRARSALGALLALIYAGAFGWAWLDYSRKAGTWFADLWLVLIALPFTATMRFVNGGIYGFTGKDTGKVLLAALFCCALAYVAGAIVEGLLRLAIGAVRRAAARRS